MSYFNTPHELFEKNEESLNKLMLGKEEEKKFWSQISYSRKADTAYLKLSAKGAERALIYR